MQRLAWLLVCVLIGCAHGEIGRVEQNLEKGVITKSTPIFVEPISAKDIVFKGDKADDTLRLSEERATIEATYHLKIASALKKLGYDAKTGSGVKSGVVVTGNVARFDHGSGAARAWVGMGAGSSNMETNIKIEDRSQKKVLSKFEVIATSGGRGGLSAVGSFMEAHLADGAEKVAEFVNGGKK